MTSNLLRLQSDSKQDCNRVSCGDPAIMGLIWWRLKVLDRFREL